MPDESGQRIVDALALLDLHYREFVAVAAFAEKYEHPHPIDTRGWSQILISTLTNTKGRGRAKGSDLVDGSDVKAASTWGAIDTPRFNGVIKAGTKSASSGKLESLDAMPFLFFVLWDVQLPSLLPRCRAWVVRPAADAKFRSTCAAWYKLYSQKKTSNNFQLHPPRFNDTDIFSNKCGDLSYPLLFSAVREGERFKKQAYRPEALTTGMCSQAAISTKRALSKEAKKQLLELAVGIRSKPKKVEKLITPEGALDAAAS